MSDLRMGVQPCGGGKVLLTLTLEAEAAGRLRELLDRAAMPGQEAPASGYPCCGHCRRRPCGQHPYPCVDGCNGAEGGHG